MIIPIQKKERIMTMNRKAEWFIESVVPRRDYTLLLNFADGQRKVYDAKELLRDPCYAPLKSVDFFMLAHRSGHSVVWNDEIDIAPENIFEKSVPV